MKRSDLNHLRRLVAWVRCEIGQDPAEMQKTMIDIADKLSVESHEISDEGKARMVESYRRAAAVPQYVRDAVKALDRYARPPGQDGGSEKRRAAVETRADAGSNGGPGLGCAPSLTAPMNSEDRAFRVTGHATVTRLREQRKNLRNIETSHEDPDEQALFTAWAEIEYRNEPVYTSRDYRMGLEAWRARSLRATSGHNALPMDTGSGHSAQEVIQRAVNAIERPEGLTDTRWEYVKAGIRLLVAEVNRVASDSALKEVGHE